MNVLTRYFEAKLTLEELASEPGIKLYEEANLRLGLGRKIWSCFGCFSPKTESYGEFVESYDLLHDILGENNIHPQSLLDRLSEMSKRGLAPEVPEVKVLEGRIVFKPGKCIQAFHIFAAMNEIIKERT